MQELNRVTTIYATMTRTCNVESLAADFNFLSKPMCASSLCSKTWLPRAGHLIYLQARLYFTLATFRLASLITLATFRLGFFVTLAFLWPRR